MDLSIHTTVTGGDDYSWLGSPHGRDTAQTVTLDLSKFVKGTDYDAYGKIPTGTALGKITTSGLYAPFKSDATDGTQTLAGFLLHAEQLQADAVGNLPTTVSVPMIVHGVIKVARLPKAPAITTETAGATAFVLA